MANGHAAGGARDARPPHTSGHLLTPRFLDYKHKNTAVPLHYQALNLIEDTFSLRRIARN